MHDLTVEQVLAIHAGIMMRDGGDNRVLSEANLHQVIFQANLLADPPARAATAIYMLCAYPAFREGNKRTAQTVAERVLAEGGFSLPGNDPRCFALMQGVMDFTVEIDEIEQYIRNSTGTG